MSGRYGWLRGPALALLAVLAFLHTPQTVAQGPDAMNVRGIVVDVKAQPVGGAEVTLQRNGSGRPIETRTDGAGTFAFSPLPAGSYQISAAKAGLHSTPSMIDPSAIRNPGHVRLVLGAPAASSAQAMEFADQPNFTVAGVMDWTAVGGHGSDSTLRTSEDLAREAAALKAQDVVHKEATGEGSDLPRAREHLRALLAHGETADLHRELAELDERAGDPLDAVHEYERAGRLDPSEQNYFAWGSELLLHRAIWQAAEIFRNGHRLHPGSARMLTALGAALFAGDLFDQAAASLCTASDLEPAAVEPYSFMGRVEIASPGPLACVEPRLARFAQQQPQNAKAYYLYAMAIWKREEHSPAPDLASVRTLLNKAVVIDPRCAEAWLQLGILATAQNRSEEALRDYSKAVEADPQSGEAHYRLAVAYDRSGAAEKARQEFQLHDKIEGSQSAAVERQRREVKQFLVVLQGQPAPAQ